MAVNFRALVEITQDSSLPRDKLSINPTFRQTLPGPWDEDAVAQDLATAISNFCGGTPEVHVRLYDLQGTKPVYPMGEAWAQKGKAAFGSTVPRELAVCLSFYGDNNRPSERGRLYVPYCVLGQGAAALAGRVPSATQTKVATLAPILVNLGGVDIQWIVWSRTRSTATQVKNWFIDDEWDTVRSRGLRPSSRATGTVTG